MKKRFILITLIIWGFQAYGAELNLAKVLENVNKKNSEIAKIKRDLDIKELEKEKAYRLAYPKLTFTSTYTKLSDGIEFGPFVLKDSDYIYSNKLTLQQPLYMGGAITSAVKIVEMTNKIAGYQAESKKREIEMEAINNYLGIVKLLKTKRILENSQKEIGETQKKLEESFRLGLIQKKPILDIKYRMSEIMVSISSLDKEVEIKKMKLKNLMGMESNEDLEIEETEPEFIQIEKINLDEDIEYAKKNKSAAKELEIAKIISVENEKIKFSEFLPKISFKANYELFGHESGGDTSQTWNAGVSANINVFDFGVNSYEYKKSKVETEKKFLDKKIFEENVELNIKSAYIEIEKLKNIIEAKEEALESARENFRIEKRKSELELNTLTELLSAENDMRKIETELSNAKTDIYWAFIKYNNIVEKERVK